MRRRSLTDIIPRIAWHRTHSESYIHYRARHTAALFATDKFGARIHEVPTARELVTGVHFFPGRPRQNRRTEHHLLEYAGVIVGTETRSKLPSPGSSCRSGNRKTCALILRTSTNTRQRFFLAAGKFCELIYFLNRIVSKKVKLNTLLDRKECPTSV